MKKVGRDDARPRKSGKRKTVSCDAAVESPENQPQSVRNKRTRKLVDPDEYQHLVGTDHYDGEDDATYRVLRIEVTKTGYVTVIRVKINKNGSLGKNEDIVFAEDVLQMTSARKPAS